MVNVDMLIYGESLNSPIITLHLGTFNRISTAEKRRRDFQENNPTLKFVCVYEEFD